MEIASKSLQKVILLYVITEHMKLGLTASFLNLNIGMSTTTITPFGV